MSKKELENNKEKNTVEPVGEQRLPSTNNLKKRHLEGLTKEATAKNIPRISLIDEALDDFLEKLTTLQI